MLWDSIEPPQVFPPPVWGGDAGGPLRPPPPDAYAKDPNGWGQQGNPPQSWNIPNPSGSSAFPNGPNMPNPMKSPWETAGGGNWNPNGQGNLQGGGWMPGAPQMPNWSNPQTIPSGNWNNSGAPNPSWTQSGTSPGKSWATVVRPSNDPQMQPGGNGQGRPQPRFDPTTGSWGGNKIDQGTPWDVVHPEDKPKGSDWNNPQSAYGFDRSAGDAMQQPWSQPPPDNSGMLWNGNKDGGQESWGPGGQNQPGPNSWDTSGHNPYGHGMGMGNQMQGGMPPGGQRPNPMWDNGGQSQSGSNVWQNPAAPGNQSWAGSGRPGYGPNPVYSPTGSLQRNDYAKPAAAFTESNVWQDPASTVRKTAQPDKGTAIWGDPHQQVGDIKRWKSNSDDATPGANMNVGSGQTSTPGAGGNGGQSAWPSGSTPAAGTSVKSTPSASGWDTTPGGGQSATTPSGSWNNPTGQGVKPNANGAGWPAEQGWGGNPKTSSSSPTKLSNGWDAPISGFSNELARPTPVSATGMPDNAGADDVFGSNPTSPLAPGNGANNNKNGIQQRLASFPALAQNILKARPNEFDKPDSDNHLQLLTTQIADQLRYAVTQELLDLKILQTPLSQPQLLLLNQLLHRVSKFELANKELKGFPDPRYTPLNPAQQQECQRIKAEINHLKYEIFQFRKAIQMQGAKPGSTPEGGNGASQEASVQSSRLNQWVGPQSGDGKTKESPPAAELNSMSLNSSADLWNTQGNKANSDWPPTSNADASSKTNNSPNSAGNNTDSQGNQQRFQIMSRKNENSESGGNDETASTRSGENNQQNNSAVEKGPPEFKPGQPWIYPEIAQTVDDNTTPLDWKQNRNNTLSIADLGVDPEQRFSNASANSSIKSAPTPTKNGPVGGNNDFWGSGDGVYKMSGMSGSSRPPSQMGNPMMNRGGNAGRSMNFNQSAFAPYNTMSAPMMSGNGSLWLVLTNIGIHVDENTVKMICMRAGNVQTFSSPIGAQFAVVRFKDAALEKIVPRIQQELQPLGIGVQLAREHEVEHLLQTASAGPMMSQGPSMWDNRSWLPFSGPHMPPACPPQFDMGAGLHGPLGDMMGQEHHPF